MNSVARDRATLVGTVLVSWLGSLGLACAFLVVGRVADDVLAGRPTGAGTWTLGAAGALVAGLASAWTVVRSSGHAARTEGEVRHAVVAQVLDLGTAQGARERTGRVVSTATDAAERVGTYRGTFLAPTFASVTVPVVVLVLVAVVLDPLSAALLALAVPFVPLAVGGFQRLFRGSSTEYRMTARRTAGAFLDAIQGLTTLRLLGAGERRARRLAATSEELRRSVMKLLAGNQVVILVADSVFWLGFVALAAWLATTRVAAGVLTPGEGVALVLLGTLLLDPLDRIGQFFYLGLSGRAAQREVDAFVAQEALVRDPAPADGGPAPVRTPDGIAVELEQVGLTYPDGTAVLHGADLRIEPGEHVVLLGRSGSGKSTLVDLLGGVLLPTSGTVRLGGAATDAMPLHRTRGLVAVVAQQTYLFTGTLADNLRLADPAATDERLWDALETAALAADVRAMPLGLDTPVGERGLSLSGGQAQRLAIARAVLRDAPLLVLDEPTAQIDLASERLVVEALGRVTRGRTVLTITHRTTAVPPGARLVVLEDGRLRPVGADGSPADVHVPSDEDDPPGDPAAPTTREEVTA